MRASDIRSKIVCERERIVEPRLFSITSARPIRHTFYTLIDLAVSSLRPLLVRLSCRLTFSPRSEIVSQLSSNPHRAESIAAGCQEQQQRELTAMQANASLSTLESLPSSQSQSISCPLWLSSPSCYKRLIRSDHWCHIARS